MRIEILVKRKTKRKILTKRKIEMRWWIVI